MNFDRGTRQALKVVLSRRSRLHVWSSSGREFRFPRLIVARALVWPRRNETVTREWI